MQTIFSKILPAAYRKWVYVGFGLVALALGATMTGFNAADVGIPVWLEVANQVYWYVAAAFGITAAANTFDVIDINVPEGTGKRRLDDDADQDHEEVIETSHEVEVDWSSNP